MGLMSNGTASNGRNIPWPMIRKNGSSSPAWPLYIPTVIPKTAPTAMAPHFKNGSPAKNGARSKNGSAKNGAAVLSVPVEQGPKPRTPQAEQRLQEIKSRLAEAKDLAIRTRSVTAAVQRRTGWWSWFAILTGCTPIGNLAAAAFNEPKRRWGSTGMPPIRYCGSTN